MYGTIEYIFCANVLWINYIKICLKWVSILVNSPYYLGLDGLNP